MFTISKVESFNKSDLDDGTDCDYITRTSNNQGILQTVNRLETVQPNPAECWSLGLLQMDFFWRSRPWYASQFMRMVKIKQEITPGAHMFITAVLNRLKDDLLSVLVRNVESKFLASKISLPVGPSGDLDFSIMEEIIDDLCFSGNNVLRKYLSDENLDDTDLTDLESQALVDFSDIIWQEFKMGDLFEKINYQKIPYKAKELSKVPTSTFDLPCLTSSFINQGLNY